MLKSIYILPCQILTKEQDKEGSATVEALNVKEENLEVARERCWKSVRGGLEITGMGRNLPAKLMIFYTFSYYAKKL